MGPITRDELIELIELGNDVMFECDGKKYTILGWYEKGPLIAEQVTEENEMIFENGAQLIDHYLINGKPLKDRLHQVNMI